MQAHELVTQLRGEAARRQVDGAVVGVQHNFGLGGVAVVSVYGNPAKQSHPNTPNLPLLEQVVTMGAVLAHGVCRSVMNHHDKICWTQSRHSRYPTTDISTHQLPWLERATATAFENLLCPRFEQAFSIPRRYLRLRDEFLVTYSPARQAHLSPHIDASVLSYIIQVNDPTEFEGGGTSFVVPQESDEDFSDPVIAPSGSTILFCGKRRHRGNATTAGRRVIIAGFVDIMREAMEDQGAASSLRSLHGETSLREESRRPHLLANLRYAAAAHTSIREFYASFLDGSPMPRLGIPLSKQRAVALHLKKLPRPNSTLDGDDLLEHLGAAMRHLFERDGKPQQVSYL